MNDNLKLTLVGGPTVVIEYAGMRFITDPTFDNAEEEYNLNIINLKKTTPPALKPKDILPIDAVLLTHDQHPDNLDNRGREFLPSAGKVLTTTDGTKRLKGNAKGFAPWQTAELVSSSGRKVKITATPCRHGPVGIEKIAGPVIGFILESDDEPTVYITGDTVYYKGVEHVSEKFYVDIILAFAGAAKTRGPFELTMSVSDLLELTKSFQDALIMPVNFEGWEHFTQGLEDITSTFKSFGISDRLFLVNKGETRSYISK